MAKSTIYQIFILIFIILIIFFTYYSFFYSKNSSTSIIKPNENINSQKFNEEVGSKIEDIYYVSKDEDGNSYEIIADNGELNQKSLDIIKLTNVKATINIKNSGIIYISSKNALYNRVNLNTYFYENVNLDYNEHIITSEDMNMNYVDKDIKISGNVNYVNNKNTLNADIIEMDMLTKVSKIYMKKNTDKIKAIIFN